MKKETIKYFNIVLSEIENFEEFSSGVILFKILEPNEKIQQEVIEFNKLVESVDLFARNEDFFIKKGNNGWHSLTPEGKKAKKLGGYLEYEKYINKKELESERLLVNNGNIIQGDNYGNQSSSNFSNNPQTNNIIANKKPTEKKNLIIKFWKLISENKLIAGILILVILYILKVKFGIDLRNP
jgi:hypothetical protein